LERVKERGRKVSAKEGKARRKGGKDEPKTARMATTQVAMPSMMKSQL
jgi:hypothetical protein